MMSATRVVKEYILTHYGHLVQAFEPDYSKQDERHISKLFSHYPVTIRDDRGNRRSVRYVEIPYLGEIVLNDELHLDRSGTTSREDVNSRIGEFLRLWTESAENLVLSATSDKIAKLDLVPYVLNPIKVIVTQLWNHDRIDEVEIDAAQSKTRAARYRQYLSLLEGIDLVRKHEDTWYPGDDFNKVQSQISKLNNGMTRIFSIILARRYSSLKQVFDITNLERIIKIENSVYLPEIEEQNGLFRDAKSIGADLARFYDDKVNHLEIESILVSLNDVGVVEEDNDLYAGVDKIRSDIIKKKKSMPSLQSKWLTAYIR